jgi:hypothetical protein
MHNVMGGSVCLYLIGNVVRSSRSPVAEDVRHLGYDIVQIGKDLSMFRRIAESSLSRSSTQRRNSLLLFLCFCFRLWRSQNLSKRLYIFIGRNGLTSLKTSRLESFRVRNGCTTWHWETSERLSQRRALHSAVVDICTVVLKHGIPYAVFMTCSCTSARYAFHGEMPSWGSVPAAWYRVRFWKSWY